MPSVEAETAAGIIRRTPASTINVILLIGSLPVTLLPAADGGFQIPFKGAIANGGVPAEDDEGKRALI